MCRKGSLFISMFNSPYPQFLHCYQKWRGWYLPRDGETCPGHWISRYGTKWTILCWCATATRSRPVTDCTYKYHTGSDLIGIFLQNAYIHKQWRIQKNTKGRLYKEFSQHTYYVVDRAWCPIYRRCGSRDFRFSAPRIWNKLPPSPHSRNPVTSCF